MTPTETQLGQSHAGRGMIGRTDLLPNDDDRPFAEIRKNIQDILRIVVTHRWAFFVPFCSVATAAFLMSLYYPRTYRATTVFERRNDPVVVNLPNAAGAASFQYFRSTMHRDLTSPAYMTDTIDRMKLTESYEKNEDGTFTEASLARRSSLARSLGSHVSISTSSPSPHLDIVRLTYTGPDPQLGCKLLDEVKRTYIRRTMVWIHDFLKQQRDYVGDQLTEAKTILNGARRFATQMRMDHPFINPSDPGSITSGISQLEMERRELQRRKRDYDTSQGELRQLLATVGPVPDSRLLPNEESPELAEYVSDTTLELIENLDDIEKQISDLRNINRMTDQHPQVQSLIKARHRLEEELSHQREQDRTVISTSGAIYAGQVEPMQRLSAPAAPWHAERNRLKVQIASLDTKLKDVGLSLEKTNASLQQLYDAKSGIFQHQEVMEEATSAVTKAQNRRRELDAMIAKIDPAIVAIEDGRLLQFSEGEVARGSSIPVNPKSTTILLLAILAGIAAGAVFVVLAEIFDHVYRSSAHVAKSLGLPILEAIDEIVTSQDRRRRLLGHTVLTPLMVSAFLLITGVAGAMAYLSIQKPWTYEKLRTIPRKTLHYFTNHMTTTPDPDLVAMVDLLNKP